MESSTKQPTTPVKLLLLDIDGVMTDGTKAYNTAGEVISKSFCDLDFTAIKRFKQHGYEPIFISGDKRVNEAMAHSRKITFIYSKDNKGKIDKSIYIDHFYEIYGIDSKDMIYIGDDVYDVGIMSLCGEAFCPSNSPNIVKSAATTVLKSRSGQGCIAELYDLIFPLSKQEYPNDL